MIFTLIISLLTEKLFYLLRQHSFSFQIVSEFIDIRVKFSNFMSGGGGLLTPCFVPRGGVLYTMIVPGGLYTMIVLGGGFLPPSSRVPGRWFWMKLILA